VEVFQLQLHGQHAAQAAVVEKWIQSEAKLAAQFHPVVAPEILYLE